MNSIKYLRPDGTEEYVSANRIRSIRDAQGNDWTQEVFDHRKRVGVTLSEYLVLHAPAAATVDGACPSLIALKVPSGAGIEVMGWREWKQPIASLDLWRQVILLPLDAKSDEFARTITEAFEDREGYRRLVAVSRTAYEERLNWDAWARAVRAEAGWSSRKQ